MKCTSVYLEQGRKTGLLSFIQQTISSASFVSLHLGKGEHSPFLVFPELMVPRTGWTRKWNWQDVTLMSHPRWVFPPSGFLLSLPCSDGTATRAGVVQQRGKVPRQMLKNLQSVVRRSSAFAVPAPRVDGEDNIWCRESPLCCPRREAGRGDRLPETRAEEEGLSSRVGTR